VNVTRASGLRRSLRIVARHRSTCGANVILAIADGCGNAGPVNGSRWTWQARFLAEGVEGLLRDKTRKPGKPPLPPSTVQRVVDLA
jgi:hypothetical protein